MNKTIDSQLLKSYIIKYDGNQGSLAEALGIAVSTLNHKINGHNTQFTKLEKRTIKARYDIPDEDYIKIFEMRG